MSLEGLILGLRGLIQGLKQLDLSLGGFGGGGCTEGHRYGRLEIHSCVLKDIGSLGPLPKKYLRIFRSIFRYFWVFLGTFGNFWVLLVL